MPAPLVSFQDVQARSRGLQLDQGFIEALIQDAEVMVRAKYPDIDARIASGVLSGAAVISVLANVVRRAAIAPIDAAKSESAGPFSRTYDNPQGDLYLRDDESFILNTGGTSSVAFSIRTLAQPRRYWRGWPQESWRWP